ncbi:MULTISPECIES: L-2-amino-thiazoline-4-carboxylic acid hydrolase [unclassified Nostoc]|uniref:L-2-amino-thiazoline-4-carboxylic acid hydrolase n=1 Tax=unclassified Nostoc TaxID=2593658 RepID=UPI002AD2EF0A|nr:MULTISPECIES: L-2-amino-thiazoline-4-carboxylic acid hydrolase [unclassified Nostoc]MDZ8123574.1 L-2-amino-thiazoline-4-carboxylic acid hydrolase [Nostoc sp. CmiVER01]MDZ8225066.1 L-2-amino-thiazoline-4-carboxylic acid hydrolase [Nostoc sp. ChiVER01]
METKIGVDKIGAGDLRMEDILNIDESKAMSLFRNRFVRYKKLAKEMGDQAAFEKMMEKYPEQQKALMGAFIDNATLAEGFKKPIPLLKMMGFVTEIVDISQNGTDATLEIQRVCPALSLAKEYGFETPCYLLCEMEQEAARRAFPGLKASILSKQAEGDCVCVFKYERPEQQVTQSTKNTSSIFSKVINLFRVVPVLIQIGIKMLKIRLSN